MAMVQKTHLTAYWASFTLGLMLSKDKGKHDFCGPCAEFGIPLAAGIMMIDYY